MYIPRTCLDSYVDGRHDKCSAQISSVLAVGYSSTSVEVAVLRPSILREEWTSYWQLLVKVGIEYAHWRTCTNSRAWVGDSPFGGSHVGA